ncbi:MAG: hypothetical protein PHY12_03215 [Eubacteriales bacterium]|nr:hypothetical protein [Eubacteriales bacterium]
MKIMVSVNHPAWAHQFRALIGQLQKRGDDVKVLVVEKDGDSELLDSFGIPYVMCCHTTGKGFVQKGFIFVAMCFRYTWEALRFRPDIFIGRASPMMAIASWVCRKPHLCYEDTEVGKFALRVCKRFSTKILTPRTFLTDLGPKQERVATYKELFYLHPSIFTPDRQKLRDAGFTPDEPYVLVRFVAWNASHDVGLHGLDDAGKLAFLKRLEKYGRVWLSSEAPLAPELEPYRLRTPYPLIHHVLAFARLVVSEGATMASEAAVLGTHALYINHIVSGSTREQSERYHLLDNFNDGGYDRALSRAEELLADPELEQKSHAQRDAMLADMIDINAYYLSETDRLARAGRHGKGAKSC